MSIRLLNERGAARYLGVTPAEMYRLRCEGVVPAAGYVRVRVALYDLEDLARYAERIGRQRTYRFATETVTLVYDEDA